MAGVPPGMEPCPYCGKAFKRLKSHLPHCKMAGDINTAFDSGKVPYPDLKASHSKPARLLVPQGKRGQTKEKMTTPDHGSKRESKNKTLDASGNKVESKLNPLQKGSTAGSEPAEKPGKNTKWQIKLASEKTQIDEGMRLAQEEARMHVNAVEERTSKAKHEKKLSKTQKSRGKNTSGVENLAAGGTLELSSLNKDEKSDSKFPREPLRSFAKQKQRKVVSQSPNQELADSLDLPPSDLESIPSTAIEGVKLVIENHRVKVLRGRSKCKIQGAPPDNASTGNCTTQGMYMEMLVPDLSENHVDTGQSDHWKNGTVTRATNTHAFKLELAESSTLSREREKNNSLTATEISIFSDPGEADCRRSPTGRASLDRSETEEKHRDLNGDMDPKASFSTPLVEMPHSSVSETVSRASEGLASSYLTCVQQLLKDNRQTGLLSESVWNTGRRDSQLALKQHLFHASENQPSCLLQPPGRNIQARAIGLEWFPALYPNYERLSMCPGIPLQGEREIEMKKMESSFVERPQVPLLEKPLMDVKLKELPAWLSACDFSPKGLVGAVQKAWSSYYNKYINVKKGGAAGISMLLAGYCILSYGWRYEHLKQDRWRQHH
ncbi:mitochondrial nucleoid-associated protein 1 [Carettochelys insculpta]|uniref:mitochondrial nucleoid-associated protein 1 n=1 Tax=Carettochelys insculpta TaxID=44489 RepID=UPI003EB76B00